MDRVLAELELPSSLGDIPILALSVQRHRTRGKGSALPTVSRTSFMYAIGERATDVRAQLVRAGLNWDAFKKQIGVSGWNVELMTSSSDFSVNTGVRTALEFFKKVLHPAGR